MAVLSRRGSLKTLTSLNQESRTFFLGNDSICQRRRDDNINKICAFVGGRIGGRDENRPKTLFSWETPRQSNLEIANFIVEKFSCHCAGS